jgi:hypothetical protein
VIPSKLVLKIIKDKINLILLYTLSFNSKSIDIISVKYGFEDQQTLHKQHLPNRPNTIYINTK